MSCHFSGLTLQATFRDVAAEIARLQNLHRRKTETQFRNLRPYIYCAIHPKSLADL